MTNITYVDRFDYSDKSSWLKVSDACLTPLRIALNGNHFNSQKEPVLDSKIYRLAIRIFAGLGALIIFPITLISLAVKWLNRREWQNKDIERQPQAAEPYEDIEDPLKKELACVHHVDNKLGSPKPGSWRAYGKNQLGEENQTFEKFLQLHNAGEPDNKPLVVQRIGFFNLLELKIIDITTDFLRVFHQIPIIVAADDMTMAQLKERKLQSLERYNVDETQGYYQQCIQELNGTFPRQNGQYDGNLVIDMIFRLITPNLRKIHDKCRVIAFTNEDLYVEGLNFVFGCASLNGAEGIWSNHRLGNPNKGPKEFEKCLLRMMKISAHEFGHMRGFDHCTDYECNIGGYMSRDELDERPLIYCLQDTAKLCSLAKTSLLDYNTNLLEFFEKFNKTYKLQCDFSKEIKTLKGRISVLEKTV